MLGNLRKYHILEMDISFHGLLKGTTYNDGDRVKMFDLHFKYCVGGSTKNYVGSIYW